MTHSFEGNANGLSYKDTYPAITVPGFEMSPYVDAAVKPEGRRSRRPSHFIMRGVYAGLYSFDPFSGNGTIQTLR